MTTREVPGGEAPSGEAAPPRDRYLDALRAGALLVVVLGHWMATLPRLQDGRMVDAEHLLAVWGGAGYVTWVVQVVPMFVFVSAAASADGAERRLAEGTRQLTWWAGRALGLARPTVTYLAVLAVLATITRVTGGRLLGPLDHSLTIHLWFLVMLLGVQALLPWTVRADRRLGLWAVAALVTVALVADVARAGVTSPGELRQLGTLVTATGGGIGWVNGLAVWLLPQQLGVAWRRGRFGGTWAGTAILTLGLAWLAVAIRAGYPVAMVGGDLAGNSNVLPPTLALVGVMWVQAGAVLVLERPLRWALRRRRVERVVGVLGALGMALYLWHKLAEVPAAWLGERLGAPIDAGAPGDAGFWLGRLWWVALCAVLVAPVLAGVVAFERRRRRDVPVAPGTVPVLVGGAALLGGITVAIALGARPGAALGLVGVVAASWLLRAHGADRREA